MDFKEILSSPGYLLKRIYYYVTSYAGIIKMRSEFSYEKALDLVFSSGGGFIRPAQRREEIRRLLSVLADRRPVVIVEIGTASGGSLFLFTRIAAQDATIVSIDLPASKDNGGYRLWRAPLYRSFALPGQDIHLIKGNSHEADTRQKLVHILDGRKIDFLFIDGDHTYDGVRKDFELYNSLLSPDGIIAFHDIVIHRPETKCEVHLFWQEVKSGFNHEEIVEDWGGEFAGIGLIKSSA